MSQTQEKTKVSQALRKVAQDAMDCQNACNLSGVSHSYMKALDVVWNEQKEGRLPPGTEVINRHPVLQLFLNKMALMSGAQFSWTTAHEECTAIVNAPEEDE